MMNALVGPSRESFESGDRIAIRITPVKHLPGRLFVGAEDARARDLELIARLPSGDNALRRDWLAERGRLETAVSREPSRRKTSASIGEISGRSLPASSGE